MEMGEKMTPEGAGGFLSGQFLVAMPGIADERFARSVIYICAHNEEGAMGFIVNQAQNMHFPELLVQLGIVNEEEAIRLPPKTQELVVQNGGPVDRSRGFVLHTADYTVESSMEVCSDICLTATVDILRAISVGKGPGKAMMVLGYAGWTAGQLENEISQNGWLTCPASASLLFDTDIDRKYETVLASAGIDPTHLSTLAGHA